MHRTHFNETKFSEHWSQKIELAQKIHASRGQPEMHGNQFWWVWPLRFRSYGSFLLAFKNGQNFLSDHGLYIVHGGQKIELAQKIHVSGG